MENINWPLSNERLAGLLDVKVGTLRQHIKNHSKELIEGQHYTRKNLGVPYAPTLMYAWTKDGAIKLAHYFKRSAGAKRFLEENNINPLHTNYIEGDLIEIIVKSFDGIYNCRKQHYMQGYRFDLFIEELGLVVECDERNHGYRNKAVEKHRAEIIEKIFGYPMIRFNPDAKLFNIGDVINKILKFAKK
jgi:very-short-patch-repair endonuclease